MRRCTASAKVSLSTRIGRVAAIDGGHLGADGVLDQVGRPGRPADLAAHLDVLDRVGDPALVDVGELPQRLVEQVAWCSRRTGAASPPTWRGRCGPTGRPAPAPPGWPAPADRRQSTGMNAGSRSRYSCAPSRSLAALVELEEVVVEVEHPDVPVGDQVELGAVGSRDGCRRTAGRSRGRRGPLRSRSPCRVRTSIMPIARAHALVCARARSRCGFSRAGYGSRSRAARMWHPRHPSPLSVDVSSV